MKALGRVQLGCLVNLVENGKWPGKWMWVTEANTERVLESLRVRRLVTKGKVLLRGPFAGLNQYQINAAGRKRLRQVI